MPKAQNVYIALGSNIEPRLEYLQKALQAISELEGVFLSKVSSIYESKAWGLTEQANFLNQVIRIDCSLAALELLKKLQNIENNLGRQRFERWGSRTIDLDILFYGEEKIIATDLIIPHPYVQQRLFVLLPLQEIEEDYLFPDGRKIKEVLGELIEKEGKKSVRCFIK